jgi:hypothetical protein
MNSKQIKDGMTKGVWLETPNVPLTINKGMVDIWSVSRNGVEHNSIANAAAITTAVNATYEQGYDPVKMLEFVRAFEEFCETGTFTRTYPKQGVTLSNLLKQCKI